MVTQLRKALIEDSGYLMICGNKNTLGKAVMEGLETNILS